MEREQVQQEISMIREMIEKTKAETAESGWFFILIGIFIMVATSGIAILESLNLHQWVWVALVAMLAGGAVIGHFTIEKKTRVKTYAKTVWVSTWTACSMAILLMTFLFPFLDLYPMSTVPVLALLVIGVAVFVTGVIFETRAVIYSGFVWWAGAIGMALVFDITRLYIMLATLLLGWVLPGIILNRQYQRRSHA
jgi:hypothetical protein